MESICRCARETGIMFGYFSKPNIKTKISLTKESMSYIEQRKVNELVAKFRIISDAVKNKYPRTSIADKYDMGRNTVTNIISAFEKNISIETQQELLDPTKTFSQIEIEEKLAPLKNTSTKPKSNKRCATSEQEKIILQYFQKNGKSVGINRMWTFIQRRKHKLGNEPPEHLADMAILKTLTKNQLRGIYKRYGLKVKKIRTKNGNVRPLYDYNALSCFERLHYDTKTIPDQKALPEDIYDKFKLNKELPIIEWNIIDVKSRFRFIAYSHERTSEFGLHFLLLVMQFIRAHTICPDMRIIIGTDNGSEFFSGSVKKQKEWNQM